MAKIVLVWNEHPTEVVAGYHCRAVAKLLRGMGHEVIVEKIPAKETNYGIITHDHEKPKSAFEKLAQLKISIEVAREAAEKHDAFAFNFHASPPDVQGNSMQLSPDDFKIGESRPTESRENKYLGPEGPSF